MNEVKITDSAVKTAVGKILDAARAESQAARLLSESGAPPTDPVGPEWQKLRDDVQRVLSQSAENLVTVADAVVTTGREFGATDSDNAGDLETVNMNIPVTPAWRR